MKYLAASSLSVAFISIFVTLGALLGLLHFNFGLTELIVTMIFYILYSCIGLGMMYHRYWTHHSFEFKNKYVKWILTYFGLVTGRGSIIGWVHVHRNHHLYSDTDKDPHMVNMNHLRIFLPALSESNDVVNKRVVRDLLVKEQLDINKYYNLIVLIFPMILFVIHPWLCYFAWFLPVFLTNIVWNSFIYYGHNKPGYQTFTDTKDNSVNSWIFSILIFGEGWHNNHHKYPYKDTTKEKPHEIDLLAYIINLVKV